MGNRSFIGLFGWGLVCAVVSIPVSAVHAQSLNSAGLVEDIPEAELPPDVTTGRRLVTPNLRVASILNRLDIDGDGVADNSPDTDGDGLPDNWEIGGFEALSATGEVVDRVVYFPAPSAIVPGTPPTPIFSRLALSTSATDPDTDGDGISDYTEVFGLRFIDENLNGLLDASEWNDKNNDGLPSPGEWPLDDSDPARNKLHDFDGFVFTDPTNDDTDGDGPIDSADNDPLINPRAFGNNTTTIVRFNLEGDADLDNDGLGNGMDLGNDLVEGDGDGAVSVNYQVIDNPQDFMDLVCLFRKDLATNGLMPESAIEDLLGVDWDSNGLWRTTDVREWSIVIDPEVPSTLPPDSLFMVGTHALYATQTFAELAATWNSDPSYDLYGGRGVGLGWHRLLEPSGQTEFLPDPRVWAILYAWRMPGFDVDGDGFIGTPNLSSTVPAPDDVTVASAALVGDVLANTVPITDTTAFAFDDRIAISGAETTDCNATSGGGDTQQGTSDESPTLDGRIDIPDGFPALPCGTTGLLPLFATALGLAMWRVRR